MSLAAIGTPSKVPKSIRVPCRSNESCPIGGPRNEQLPVGSVAAPASLIAPAIPSGSPGNVGSSSICILCQITGLNWRTCGGTQVGSAIEFSANPSTSPRLLMLTATPLVPPSVGSGSITPARQTNGRQTRKSGQEEKLSPNGSGVEVSEKPTTSSRSFTPDAWLNGPPRLPRSVITPLRQRNACAAVSPGRVAKPTTEPLLLMVNAWLKIPPNVPRSVTE